MVMQRRGVGSLGCLVLMLLAAATVYFGVNIGEHFFRFYQFQDSMRQEVKFAAHNSDAPARSSVTGQPPSRAAESSDDAASAASDNAPRNEAPRSIGGAEVFP